MWQSSYGSPNGYCNTRRINRGLPTMNEVHTLFEELHTIGLRRKLRFVQNTDIIIHPHLVRLDFNRLNIGNA